MANPAKYQSLSQLRGRILLRLGFVAQNASNQHALIDEFLQSAQEELILDFEDMLLRDVFLTDNFIEGQSRYDVVAECDPEQVDEVVYRDAPSDTWIKLKRGIPIQLRGYQSGDPYYYEIRWGDPDTAQFDFYPEPDSTKEWGYSFKHMALSFANDDDKTTIDSELVFLRALSIAQRHFGYSEDSLVTDGRVQNRLYRLRVRSNHGYEIRRGVDRADSANTESDLTINVTSFDSDLSNIPVRETSITGVHPIYSQASGAIDGVNTVFTMPFDINENSMHVSYKGVLQQAFTEGPASNQVTMGFAPTPNNDGTTNVLVFDYEKTGS